MKVGQYKKYKEVYQVDIDIIKQLVKKCDCDIKEITNKIIKIQKGGNTNNDNLFMLIPIYDL